MFNIKNNALHSPAQTNFSKYKKLHVFWIGSADMIFVTPNQQRGYKYHWEKGKRLICMHGMETKEI